MYGHHFRRFCGKITYNAWSMGNSASTLKRAKPFDEIPHLKSFPLIGSTWAYLPLIGKYKATELHRANEDKYKKYGKIVREVSFGGHNFVHLFDPNDIETVFRNEGKMPWRLAMPPLVTYFEKEKNSADRSSGLLLLQGEEWLNLRSKVQVHMLNMQSVRNYLPQMDMVAREMVQKVTALRDSSGEVPDFLNEIYKWALESIALIVLDRRLGCLNFNLPVDSEPYKMIKAANCLFSEIMPLSLGIPIWRLMPTPSWRRLVNALDIFHETAKNYIAEAVDKLKTSSDKEAREFTLLESLLLSTNNDKRDALAMAIDSLLGGIDTTSHSLSFILYHLAKNQDAQNKAYQEVINTGVSQDERIRADVLDKIPYLRACFKESLRLHPVISGTTRRLDKDVVLSGYTVPARVLLILHTGIIGRFDDYFVDADKFKPERWMRDTREEFNRFLSLPFSFGTRMCIGRRLAEQELWLLLIRILLNFKIEYHHEDIDIESRFVNAPNKPLRFQFISRV